jgi:hypothetical protein
MIEAKDDDMRLMLWRLKSESVEIREVFTAAVGHYPNEMLGRHGEMYDFIQTPLSYTN